MKRAATHLFKRQSKNRAFSKLSNFYFDLRPPSPGRPPGKTEERKPDGSGATRMCESPGVARGGGGWSGLELTDT